MKPVLGFAALAGCAVMAVAGCGVTHATHTTLAAAPATAARLSSPGPSSPGPSSPGPAGSAGTPRQRAVADAAAILRSFVVPPGARRLARAPSFAGNALRQPPSTPGVAELVDDASWWQVPGDPQAVLGWEQARLPHQFAWAANGEAGNRSGTYSWMVTYSLPPVPGVLPLRELLVEVVGQTAIRVDGQVGWQPPRPASSLVPSAARVVTITQVPGSLPGARRPPAPVTITDAAVTERLASLINGLSVFPFWYASCPAFMGGGLKLTFRARAGGPALAVANTGGPCHEVWLTVGGRQQPGLTDPASLDAQMRAIADLHWHVS
jgi:hypothetical protein